MQSIGVVKSVDSLPTVDSFGTTDDPFADPLIVRSDRNNSSGGHQGFPWGSLDWVADDTVAASSVVVRRLVGPDKAGDSVIHHSTEMHHSFVEVRRAEAFHSIVEHRSSDRTPEELLHPVQDWWGLASTSKRLVLD